MKKKISEKDFSEIILDLLHRRRGKSFKSRDISRALKVSKQDYHLFREALRSLVKQRKIVRLRNKRFTLPFSLQKRQGTLEITKKGFGFVTDQESGEEIFIPAQYLHTAFDGDQVEVQLFAISRGKSKEGQISTILKRAHKTFVGVYHHSEYYGFVVPDDPKVYRDFYIAPQNTLGATKGQKVVIEFLKWDSASLSPEGRIIEILGFPDEPGVDILSLMKGFELPIKFPPQTLNEAEQLDFQITPQLLAERLDLRDEETFTIDPPDAKDFDDAVSLKNLQNGNYLLSVHIADVSYFVAEGSAIDKEALDRGLSIYLVDRVIPMLPKKLSTNLCSLQPNQPKLTISCIMEINKKGERIDYRITPSIILSKRRFTYEEAQSVIEDPDSSDPFAKILREMRNLSQLFRKNRLNQGSIDFETPEVRFLLNESGKPTEIIPVKRLESHQLIEEFMLMANKTIAEHIQIISNKKSKLPFLYRIHEKPDNEKVTNFGKFLEALGFRVKIPQNISPKSFQELMNKVLGTKDDVLIKEVALRTMMKANYSNINKGHFGLAFLHYTHFTSPIRRYPDLTVHRLLSEYRKPISNKRAKTLEKHLKKIGEICSERERLALEAERESIKIKQIEWIADYVGETFNGLISGVTSNGLFVEIIPYLIEGFVRIANMEDDYYIYDEKTYSLIGREFGKIFRLGNEVKIAVQKVNLEINQVDFALISNM
jgi:ribonuclease R